VKRLAAAAVAISTFGILAAFSPAQAASLCVNADINVNGNAQKIEQCLPE
jgi:hypothetical protein